MQAALAARQQSARAPQGPIPMLFQGARGLAAAEHLLQGALSQALRQAQQLLAMQPPTHAGRLLQRATSLFYPLPMPAVYPDHLLYVRLPPLH